MTKRATLFISKAKPNEKETFGLKSSWEPERIPELKKFEDSMLNLIQNIQFKNTSRKMSKFQRKIKSDIKKVKTDEKMYVKADKSNNYYKMSKEDYKNFCSQNVQKDYKKCDANEVKKLIEEEKKVACDLGIGDRMDIPSNEESYLTLKDHKPNFRNNPKFRLIDPNKTELGKVSKNILQRVNDELRSKLNVNQWRSSEDVIKWFTQIQNKGRKNFIQYDIVDFYPSITENILKEAIEFARKFTVITPDEERIILTAKNKILISDSQPWKKKNCANYFDNTQGTFDGAELCELVGIYILPQLQKLQENNGLYRDDGLMASKLTPRQNENLKKKICQIFENNGLKITIQANVKVVDFLDLTLDLQNVLFKPFIKPNNSILYINVGSNHPPKIVKNIPLSVNRRLSSLSKNEEIFNVSTGPYQDAVKHDMVIAKVFTNTRTYQ